MKRAPWFKITAKADSDEPVEVLLYGEISSYQYGDTVNARGFIDAIKQYPADRQLKLRINSPGGDVFQGQAMFSYLKGRGKVTAYIDGMAASMASIVAMAADKIVMPANAMLMIHRVSGYVYGDAGDLEEYKDLLEKLDGQMATIYAARSGKTAEECLELMDGTTWLTGAEAVAEGFADEETEEIEITARVRDFKPILARYGKLPAGFGGADAPPPQNKPPTPEPNMLKLLTALAAAKLIPHAKCTEDEAVDLLKDVVAQQQKALNDATAERDALQTKLDAADKAARKKVATDAIAAAVKAGKIKDEPGLRGRWETAYLNDPESTQAMLDGMSGTVTPPKKGAAPAPELPGDDLGDDQPKTLDEVRAALLKETDPDKKWALAQQARELRGHKELFAGK